VAGWCAVYNAPSNVLVLDFGSPVLVDVLIAGGRSIWSIPRGSQKEKYKDLIEIYKDLVKSLHLFM